MARRVVGVAAALYAVRMLGLFLLLPVLAPYAEGVAGGTLFLAGVAVGAYGLTQALLQIPFGILSDRFGRVPLILTGLALFAGGSVVAALSTGIHGLIAGRTLQGAGAISAVLTALVADHTPTDARTRAMAIIGVTIGGCFMFSLIAGPTLTARIGVAGVFWLTAVLACAGAALLLGLPAAARAPRRRNDLAAGGFRSALQAESLLMLDAGIFLLHLMLAATFTAVPFVLRDEFGLPAGAQWQVYLGVLTGSLVGTAGLILLTERGVRGVLPAAVAVGGAAQLLLAPGSFWLAMGALTLFFAAFNYLEARLPALLSQVAPSSSRGTALGVYASGQYLGIFAGGVLGGLVLERSGPAAVFLMSATAAFAWLMLLLVAATRGSAQSQL
ncbi:MFS transporter [soil metagenome]